jgi:tRNA (guanine-N7-)-methyltransferase
LPAAGPIADPHGLYHPRVQTLWLEIGFGGGEHLAAQAAAHPEIGFIGCEPFINGVVSALGHIARQRLANVRLWPDDARLLLDRLPDAMLDRVFLLFPDPWPKARHKKRRFVSPENLDRLARLMRPGAELRLGSDDVDYVDWMLAHLDAHPAFESTRRDAADRWLRPPDWVPTRYEAKAAKQGVRPAYLGYRRR